MNSKNNKTDQYQTSLTTKLRNIPTGVLLTAEFLLAEYGPLLSTANLASLFGIEEDTIKQNISRRKFTIPVTKMGSKYVATPFDVANHLENNKIK